jgi:hypothetical protein
MGWAAILPPGRAEFFPPFIMPTALSMRGAICPQAALDYVIFTRADGGAHAFEKLFL